MNTTALSPNTLAFMALANEYCRALENASDTAAPEFLGKMLKLLPRIYMTATDLQPSFAALDDEENYIAASLSEEYYDSVRRAVESLLGPEDIYLEVFEEDMKYSDTPVSASVSEALADIFQVLYNFLESARDATDEHIDRLTAAVLEDFRGYWSQPLCNVMRPLNHIYYSGALASDND